MAGKLWEEYLEGAENSLNRKMYTPAGLMYVHALATFLIDFEENSKKIFDEKKVLELKELVERIIKLLDE